MEWTYDLHREKKYYWNLESATWNTVKAMGEGGQFVRVTAEWNLFVSSDTLLTALNFALVLFFRLTGS